MFNKITIAGRINILIGAFLLSCVIFFLIFVNGQNTIKEKSLTTAENQLDSCINVKLKLSTHALAIVLSKELEKNDSISNYHDFFMDKLQDIHFEEDNSGYFSVNQETFGIFHPVKDVNGKDRSNEVDSEGSKHIVELYKKAANGGGFFTYSTYKPGIGNRPKISYAEMIPNTNFWLTTGVYLDNVTTTHNIVENQIDKIVNTQLYSLIIVFFLVLVTVFILSWRSKRNLIKSIEIITSATDDLILGNLKKTSYNKEDELGRVVNSINTLTDRLETTSEFTKSIGNNEFDFDFEIASEHDTLGKALIATRDKLRIANENDIKRKKDDDQRNWVITGQAMLGDIIRNNQNNVTELVSTVLQNLINYTKCNQGGIFLYSNENGEECLNLEASYAYDRKKFLSKKIEIGEGLVGTCAIEKKTIYMTQIPQDYINITSGLGGATPNNLIIVPMLVEDNLLGIIELASFNKLEQYQIEFIEKVAENIASSIMSAQIAENTNKLLQQTMEQANELAAQEEEMRQNMEELQATQEESQRREKQLSEELYKILEERNSSTEE